MIVRSFRGTVRPGSEERFYAIIRERLGRFREQNGMIESHLARRMTDAGDVFLVTTHWPSWAALRGWAEEPVDRPWGFEEVLPFLVSWEIEHFEEIERVGAGADE